MVNYARAFSQSESGKYFECLIVRCQLYTQLLNLQLLNLQPTFIKDKFTSDLSKDD